MGPYYVSKPEPSKWPEHRKEFESIAAKHENPQSIRAMAEYDDVGKCWPWILVNCQTESIMADLDLAFARAGSRLMVPTGSTSRNHWLDRLHSNLAGSRSKHAKLALAGDSKIRIINDVLTASVIFCSKLETAELDGINDSALHDIVASSVNELRAANQDAPQEVPPGDFRPERFPNRAKWLRERLKERAWDHNDPNRYSGPDRKTIKKMLAGEFVREGILEKLVLALNHKKIGKILSLMDIPSD